MSIFKSYADIKTLDAEGVTKGLAEQVYAYAVTCFISQIQGYIEGGYKEAVAYYNNNRTRLERELQWQLDKDIATVSVWSDKRGDAVIDVTFDQVRLSQVVMLNT